MRREGRRGRGRRKFHSLVPSHQIGEGNTDYFPFSSASGPPLVFRFLPLWTGDSTAGGPGPGGRPGAQPTGPSPGSVSGLAGSLAVTRHALPLVREASPSCFPSFITVLFVVRQIKFFWRRGREMREREERREREKKHK